MLPSVIPTPAGYAAKLRDIRSFLCTQAPEVFDGNRYNTSADVYSFAVTIFECACGRHHVLTQYKRESRYAACGGWRPEASGDLVELHPLLWALIQECWRSEKQKDEIAAKRPTFREIAERLESMGLQGAQSTTVVKLPPL